MRCRTMIDSFLAGSICHAVIGRKMEQRSSSGGQKEEDGGPGVAAVSLGGGGGAQRHGKRDKLGGPPHPLAPSRQSLVTGYSFIDDSISDPQRLAVEEATG